MPQSVAKFNEILGQWRAQMYTDAEVFTLLTEIIEETNLDQLIVRATAPVFSPEEWDERARILEFRALNPRQEASVLARSGPSFGEQVGRIAARKGEKLEMPHVTNIEVTRKK